MRRARGCQRPLPSSPPRFHTLIPSHPLHTPTTRTLASVHLSKRAPRPSQNLPVLHTRQYRRPHLSSPTCGHGCATGWQARHLLASQLRPAARGSGITPSLPSGLTTYRCISSCASSHSHPTQMRPRNPLSPFVCIASSVMATKVSGRSRSPGNAMNAPV
jgi:hypothetical protein